MAKRGRKKEHYFGPEEEAAVIKYLESEDPEEKNEIYNKHLKDVFIKMAESIIRTFKLQRERVTHDELMVETLSHLVSKMDRFDPELNKKAYSYFSRIIKNYLLGLRIKQHRVNKKKVSFDENYSSFEEDDTFSYTLPENEYGNEDLLKDIVKEIQLELDNEGVTKKKMNDNERKLGLALIEVLGNWEGVFGDMEGGSKYDKNRILSTIRDYTGISTKDIRMAMKRYKKLYAILKMSKIRDGFI
jgi:DNA-directed RNA polymerase specialized sigma24 family protein